MAMMQTRRDLATMLVGVGTASFVGAGEVLADEGPPETTTIRIGYDSSICLAPDFLARELLRAEGFTDIRYLPHSLDAVAQGDYDFDFDSVTALLPFLDTSKPMT